MNPSLNETPGQSGPQGAGVPPVPLPAPNPVPAAADDVSTTRATSSSVLDDSDKVEKNWVNKARKIVGQSRGDPYRQNKELTVLKADYMKQRYNKIIKVDK